LELPKRLLLTVTNYSSTRFYLQRKLSYADGFSVAGRNQLVSILDTIYPPRAVKDHISPSPLLVCLKDII